MLVWNITLKITEKHQKFSQSKTISHLDVIFVASAISSISDNDIVITKVIAEISECSGIAKNGSSGATHTIKGCNKI